MNRGEEKEDEVRSREIVNYLPQVTETTSGGTSTTEFYPEVSYKEIFLYLYGYDGKKVIPSLHSHGYSKNVLKMFTGTVDERGLAFPYLGYQLHRHGPLGQVTAPFTAVVNFENNRNKALSKFYDKLFTTVDLSVDTWQWKQTYELGVNLWKMVQFLKNKNPNAIKKAYDAYQSARRRLAPITFGPKKRKKPVDWRKIGRNTGGAWLQFSYGVRPLMQDIYDTLDAMRAPKRQIVKIQVTKATREFVDKPLTGYDLSGRAGWTLRGINRKIVRHSFDVDYVIAESAMDSLKRFTTMDPKRFLWENIPFSFVADWFIDFGGWMELMEHAQNSARGFAGGTESSVVRCESNYTAYLNGSNFLYEQVGVADAWAYFVEKHRTVLTGSPVPRVATVRVDFSSPWRALNAISLLLQGFRK
jgi:hypothetical protein